MAIVPLLKNDDKIYQAIGERSVLAAHLRQRGEV